jgi:hypothetical protein
MRRLRLVSPDPPLERWRPDIERDLPPLHPEVQTMLTHLRIIAPLPYVVRARALARARATLGRRR